ncbi:hypothetical protein [Streptomyces niveiscabiei]|uniref:hypothetical protein n=1 Tax=Streptomyces niveiscabiei TaxID=164115 RepID=UPI0038F6E8A7
MLSAHPTDAPTCRPPRAVPCSGTRLPGAPRTGFPCSPAARAGAGEAVTGEALPGFPQARAEHVPDEPLPDAPRQRPASPYGRAGVGRVMAAGRRLAPVHGPRRPPPTRVASAPHHPAAGNRTTPEGETR